MEDGFFRQVTIVGVGLIGGSLGLAWRGRGGVGTVVGVDVDEASLRRAREIGAVDRATTDLAEGVAGADLVVMATPVRVTLELIGRLGPLVGAGAVVTDVGSTKVEVCRLMREGLPAGVTFVGGHPMAGSEGQGIEAADPYLFQNAVYVLTPEEDADPAAVAALRRLVEAAGAQVVLMDPERHDRWVAAVSHLPQLVAVALVNAVADADREDPGLLALAAGGFRDTTRITSSPAGIWLDILATNRDRILPAVARFRAALSRLEEALAAGDLGSALAEFERARAVRRALPRRPKGLLPAYFELVVTVPDRPGVIGGLATLLGEQGINIEDIEILRLREGEGGTIRLGFATEAEGNAAFEALQEGGYKVQRR